MPELSSFTEEQHNIITDEGRCLYLKDIAGLPIGHVPRCIAGVFRAILDDGGTIRAKPTGIPVPSFPPWPALQEKGGGIVIPCNYIINSPNQNSCIELLVNMLSKIPEECTMSISLGN